MPKLIAVPLAILLFGISGLAIANATSPSPIIIFTAYLITINSILLMTSAKRLYDNKYTTLDYIYRYFCMPWLLVRDHFNHRLLVLDVLQTSSLTGQERDDLETVLYFKTPSELKALLLKNKASHEARQ
ncbi:hypothetical protein ACP3V3_01825 [Vibrio sp. PNB22_3_1]